MKLHVLGTAGYHPNESRHTTCVMIPELGIVFDAGTAFFRVGNLLETDELDIFLSHAHLDHVAGLTYLLDILAKHPLSKVRVHGEAEKLLAVREHLFHPSIFPVDPPFTSVVLAESTTVLGQGVVTHFPLDHPGGSRGYRLDLPHTSMAFVTDTTARLEADYVRLILGVNVLIHECNFADGQEELSRVTGHSHTSAVAQVAAAAQVKRLILIHMNPLSDGDDPIGIEAARNVFPNTAVARDGEEFEF